MTPIKQASLRTYFTSVTSIMGWVDKGRVISIIWVIKTCKIMMAPIKPSTPESVFYIRNWSEFHP